MAASRLKLEQEDNMNALGPADQARVGMLDLSTVNSPLAMESLLRYKAAQPHVPRHLMGNLPLGQYRDPRTGVLSVSKEAFTQQLHSPEVLEPSTAVQRAYQEQPQPLGHLTLQPDPALHSNPSRLAALAALIRAVGPAALQARPSGFAVAEGQQARCEAGLTLTCHPRLLEVARLSGAHKAALLQGYKPASSRSPTTRHVELAQLCTGSEHERRWLGAVLVLGAQRLVEVQVSLAGAPDVPLGGETGRLRLSEGALFVGSAPGMSDCQGAVADVDHTEPFNSFCTVCGSEDDAPHMLLCDSCEHAYHGGCLKPKVTHTPEGDWLCHACTTHKSPHPFPAPGHAAGTASSPSATGSHAAQAPTPKHFGVIVSVSLRAGVLGVPQGPTAAATSSKGKGKGKGKAVEGKTWKRPHLLGRACPTPTRRTFAIVIEGLLQAGRGLYLGPDSDGLLNFSDVQRGVQAPEGLSDVGSLLSSLTTGGGGVETAKKPLAVTTAPKRFQLEGLAWMLARERASDGRGGAGVVFLHPDWVQLVGCGGVVLYVNRTDLCVSTSFEVSPRGETCGGLICDEMGLGKTLQSLMLIASHKPPPGWAEPSDAPLSWKHGKGHTEPCPVSTTLIVAPSNLIPQWRDEIKRHLAPGALRWGIIQPSTPQDMERDQAYVRQGRLPVVMCTGEGGTQVALHSCDVALLSYEVLTAKPERGGHTWLYHYGFWRVMLDEAQMVANSSGEAAKLASDLWRRQAWVVTGTPISNDLSEVHGLLLFLDEQPYSMPSVWRRLLYTPITSPNKAAAASALKALWSLLRGVMLRRTKASVEQQLDLPPCTIEDCTLPLGPLERYVYEETNRKLIEEFRRPGAADALADAAARLVASSGKPAACTHGKLGATATSLLSLYTKLRQSCCHPQVVAGQQGLFGRGVAALASLSMEEIFDRIVLQAYNEYTKGACKAFKARLSRDLAAACTNPEAAAGNPDCVASHQNAAGQLQVLAAALPLLSVLAAASSGRDVSGQAAAFTPGFPESQVPAVGRLMGLAAGAVGRPGMAAGGAAETGADGDKGGKKEGKRKGVGRKGGAAVSAGIRASGASPGGAKASPAGRPSGRGARGLASGGAAAEAAGRDEGNGGEGSGASNAQDPQLLALPLGFREGLAAGVNGLIRHARVPPPGLEGARRRYLRWLQLFTSCLSLAIQLLEQQQAKEAGRKQASRTAVLPGTGTAAVVPPPEAVRPLVEEGWCAPLGVEHLPQLKAQLTDATERVRVLRWLLGKEQVPRLACTRTHHKAALLECLAKGWLPQDGPEYDCVMDALRDDRTKTGNPNPNSGQIRPHDPTNPADMARLRGALDIVLGPVMGRAVVGTERADGSGGARQSAAVTQVLRLGAAVVHPWLRDLRHGLARAAEILGVLLPRPELSWAQREALLRAAFAADANPRMGDERRAAQAVRGALRGVADYTAVAQTLAAADQLMPELQPELEHALAAAEEEEGEGNGGPDGNPLGDAAAAGAAARADDAEGGLQQGVLVPEGLDGAGVARVVGAGEARRRAEEWLAVGGLGPVARLTRELALGLLPLWLTKQLAAERAARAEEEARAAAALREARKAEAKRKKEAAKALSAEQRAAKQAAAAARNAEKKRLRAEASAAWKAQKEKFKRKRARGEIEDDDEEEEEDWEGEESEEEEEEGEEEEREAGPSSRAQRKSPAAKEPASGVKRPRRGAPEEAEGNGAEGSDEEEEGEEEGGGNEGGRGGAQQQLGGVLANVRAHNQEDVLTGALVRLRTTLPPNAWASLLRAVAEAVPTQGGAGTGAAGWPASSDAAAAAVPLLTALSPAGYEQTLERQQALWGMYPRLASEAAWLAAAAAKQARRAGQQPRKAEGHVEDLSRVARNVQPAQAAADAALARRQAAATEKKAKVAQKEYAKATVALNGVVKEGEGAYKKAVHAANRAARAAAGACDKARKARALAHELLTALVAAGGEVGAQAAAELARLPPTPSLSVHDPLEEVKPSATARATDAVRMLSDAARRAPTVAVAAAAAARAAAPVAKAAALVVASFPVLPPSMAGLAAPGQLRPLEAAHLAQLVGRGDVEGGSSAPQAQVGGGGSRKRKAGSGAGAAAASGAGAGPSPGAGQASPAASQQPPKKAKLAVAAVAEAAAAVAAVGGAEEGERAALRQQLLTKLLNRMSQTLEDGEGAAEQLASALSATSRSFHSLTHHLGKQKELAGDPAAAAAAAAGSKSGNQSDRNAGASKAAQDQNQKQGVAERDARGRQVVDLAGEDSEEEVEEEGEEGPQQECVICLDIIQRATVTTCAHTFCTACIREHLVMAEEQAAGGKQRGGARGGTTASRAPAVQAVHMGAAGSTAAAAAASGAGAGGVGTGPAPEPKPLPCPICRTPLGWSDLFDAAPKAASKKGGAGRSGRAVATDVGAGQGGDNALVARVGAKLAALITELGVMGECDPTSKALVFSSWPRLLQLAGESLADHGIRFASLAGTSPPERQAALHTFRNDPTCRVLLLLLTHKGGASGLTLTEAAASFLLEPSTDPGVEAQAAARIHRMGQTRPSRVVRLLAADTIEQRVLAQQAAKRASGQATKKAALLDDITDLLALLGGRGPE